MEDKNEVFTIRARSVTTSVCPLFVPKVTILIHHFSLSYSSYDMSHLSSRNSTGRNGRYGIFAFDDEMNVDEDCTDSCYYSLRVQHTTLISNICRDLDALTVMTDGQTYELRYKGELLKHDSVETVGSMRIKGRSVLCMTNG